jgi:Zn-dependent M16 (insulinase) family peptidase
VIPSGQGKILYHDLFTNGILYLDLGFDLQHIPQDSLPYLPLFSQALLETGAGDQDFVQLLQRIGMHTGGIHPTTFTSTIRESRDNTAWLFLRGKAMLPKTGELLSILKDVLFTARLDNRERIRQMVLESKAGIEASIVQSGHMVINTRLRARFTAADWADEEMGGVNQLFFLRKLVDLIDKDWMSVQTTLEGIRTALINQAGLVCNITVDQAGWQLIRAQVEEFIVSVPITSAQPARWSPSAFPQYEGLTLPTQVNFVGKATNLYEHGYHLQGSAYVIPSYLNSSWLWERVRVQGGAYGGLCAFDTQSGVFSFLSYRDPNLSQTLDVYDQTASFLEAIKLSESELTRAIIGAISNVDAYQLPDAKGYTSMLRHLLNITDEERQQRRDEILGTSEADFHAFAEAVRQVQEHGSVVVLASPEAVTAANKSKGEWLVTTRVM